MALVETPTRSDFSQALFPITDENKKFCSILVTVKRNERQCRRVPTHREWTQIESDQVAVYEVCAFHFALHLADGVINKLGKLM